MKYDTILQTDLSKSNRFLETDLGIELNSDFRGEFTSVSEIVLEDMSSIAALEGDFSCSVIISAKNELCKVIIQALLQAELNDEEMNSCITEAATEISNVIIGNVIGQFPGQGNNIELKPPVRVTKEDISVDEYEEILSSEIRTGYGVFRLYIAR
ncbi:MAG: chemotaxis protein CheX [bacterium]|nr:chemotaxis protein CheX [bacterium]